MKKLVKYLFVLAGVALFVGCASQNTAFVPRLPRAAKAVIADYETLPGHKALVLAVDPNGDFAVGVESGSKSAAAAKAAATKKCVAGRMANGVLGTAYVYALNDDIVFSKKIVAAQ